MALPSGILRNIFEFVIDTAHPFKTISLSLVNRAWHSAYMEIPLRCRVHVLTTINQQDDRVVAFNPISVNPFQYPLVANEHHENNADYFVQIELHSWTWSVLESYEELDAVLTKIIHATTSHTKIIVTDVIANASNCQPIKCFDNLCYEDSLDDRKWCRYKSRRGPPLASFSALRVGLGESTEWREFNLSYHNFPKLKQLVIHQDEWYLNPTFHRHPTLTTLDINVEGWEDYTKQMHLDKCNIKNLRIPHLNIDDKVNLSAIGINFPLNIYEENESPMLSGVQTIVLTVESSIVWGDEPTTWLGELVKNAPELGSLILSTDDATKCTIPIDELCAQFENIFVERIQRFVEEPQHEFMSFRHMS
ncbi:hypothetical protein THRCLA_04948 [Thraustotheca clavata]|uniref:F-box domain-containing protein n=1 Tax=Thraustotheca clavata TaxID=74557 RepID=A0A1V9ZXE4_9STRA|nr:hypothetical protein THRCLA_04948 [Thraustotheca clavata]